MKKLLHRFFELLHKWFGIGKHTWKRARGNQSRDLKYCDCGELATVKRRKGKS